MIRTFLHAEAAVVAGRLILHHMQNLELRLRMEHFEKISDDAESSEKYGPWNVGTKNVSHIICSEEHSDPYPELQRIRDRSERTEIAAPEHVDEEASENDDADAHNRHPEGYLSLEACRYRIVWVEVLAEQLARIHRHVEDPEHKGILDDAEHLVQNRSVAHLDALDVHGVACLAEKVLHCAQRADVCAEELAEQHHGSN